MNGSSPPAFVFEATLVSPIMAEVCALVPGTERTSARDVRTECETIVDVARRRVLWTTLAGTLTS